MLKRRKSNTKSDDHQEKQKSLESQMEQKSLERQMEPRAPYVFSKSPNRYLEKDPIVEKVIFCTTRYLLVQNQHLKQKFKHLNRNVWNLFKVYNKTTSVTSFRCLCCFFEQISRTVVIFPLIWITKYFLEYAFAMRLYVTELRLRLKLEYNFCFWSIEGWRVRWNASRHAA